MCICTQYVNECDTFMLSLGGIRSESIPVFFGVVPFSEEAAGMKYQRYPIPKKQRLDLHELSAINRYSWLCKSIDAIQLSSASSIEFAEFDGSMDLQCRCTLPCYGLPPKTRTKKSSDPSQNQLMV